MEGEPAFAIRQSPMGIDGVMVPLPSEFQIRGRRSEEGGVRNVEIIDEIG